MTFSYAIIIEHAKFDRLYLNDDFNCLERVISGDSVNHFFNIIHACTCVAVLFTDQLETASLCWAFVLAQICHACCDTFQFLYNVRFPSEDKTVDTFESVALFMLYIAYLLLSTLIVIHRYYDMTNILQKRTQRFTSSIYSGRLLNEHIIYKNESKFLQKKYTLRQAQALQIYGIVQKIQHFKNRGIKPNPLDIQNDVKLACDMLKNLKNLTGPNLLRELRKRNAKRLKALQDMDSLDEIGVNAQGDRGRRRKERKSKSKKNNNAKISNNENETPTT
ncbi:uncharacterized protein LOC118438027 [Folsomia candida]|uniref:uncharacterized protein LOC118438027 n=1 Tax=Folsomia candida TaxID=158441 RepID=UPI0016050A47|nr:uncharacterized protein LOC118438027 [Folsomia candida]